MNEANSQCFWTCSERSSQDIRIDLLRLFLEATEAIHDALYSRNSFFLVHSAPSKYDSKCRTRQLPVRVFATRALATVEDKNVASCYLFFVARPFHLGLKWEGGSFSCRDHSSPLDLLLFEVASSRDYATKRIAPATTRPMTSTSFR
jgi:hypothetical protein